MKFGSKEYAETTTRLVADAEETGCFLDFEGAAAVRLASKYAGASNTRAAKSGLVVDEWGAAHFNRAHEVLADLSFTDLAAACLWAEGRALEREFDVERLCFARIACFDAMHARLNARPGAQRREWNTKYDSLVQAKTLAARRCRRC